MLEDSDDQSQPVKELARHDIQLFRDLLQLNVKMNKLSVCCGPAAKKAIMELLATKGHGGNRNAAVVKTI